MKWNPYSVKELSKVLEGASGWFLDGGYSLDYFLGKSTRTHHDIDIGVFSSDVDLLLKHILEKGFSVHVANRNLCQFQPLDVVDTDYNYWVSDKSGYRFQVLVYLVEDNVVKFRRNQGVTWPKSEFLISKDGLLIVSPLITYAFKVTASSIEPKDLQDIAQLSAWVANC